MSIDQASGVAEAGAYRNQNEISMDTILALSQQIAQTFHPERIILFGSYAEGQPTADSDVDLMVLMKTALRNRQQAALIARTLDYHFGLDLLVRTPEQFRERFALGDPFVCRVAQTGKVLYERAQPGMGG